MNNDIGDTRERILAEAERLVRGSATFTLNELADRLGLHYTAVYHYFENRDDLELHLIERYSRRRSRHLANVQQTSMDGVSRLMEFIALEMHEPPSGLLIRGRVTLAEAYRKRAIEAYRHNRTELAGLLEQGMQDGSIRTTDPDIIAHTIVRLLDRYANQQESVFTNAGHTADTLAAELTKFIIHGILPEGATELLAVQRPRATFSNLQTTNADVLLRTATESFNLNGYRRTSIPELAKGLGQSKTAFYRYAASKDELLFLCAMRSLNIASQIGQLSNAISKNPLEVLLHDVFFSRMMLQTDPGPLLSPYLFDELSEQRARVAWEIFNANRARLATVLEDCSREGLIRVLDPVAVQPMITTCTYIPFADHDDLTGHEDPVAQMILRGIGT